MRGTQATTLLFSEEQGSVSSFVSGLIETMEILFLLLGFLFFVKGCTGLTLYGEVGGTVVFQCNSTIKDIISIYFQGGPGFTDFIIGYHKTKNLTGPSRPDTYLNHVDKTDLGPVSYEWKEDEGEWTEGEELKNISSSDTPEKFFCRLKTRVRTSDTSLPMENPLYKPPVAFFYLTMNANLCLDSIDPF
ncbi:unnamed protein product [Arctogadus glacialis]